MAFITLIYWSDVFCQMLKTSSQCNKTSVSTVAHTAMPNIKTHIDDLFYFKNFILLGKIACEHQSSCSNNL